MSNDIKTLSNSGIIKVQQVRNKPRHVFDESENMTCVERQENSGRALITTHADAT